MQATPLRADDLPLAAAPAQALKAGPLRLAEAPTPPDAKALVKHLAPYREPSTARSLGELAITFIPLVLLWWATAAAVGAGYWVGLLLTIPAAGFLLRMFLIQHDCGHGAFFRRRRANDWLGRAIGVLTLTPYDCWRRSHAIHHASTGNLDGRGFGDVDTLTVAEYRARGAWGRAFYRVYRHPLVIFGFGPIYLFILRHRLPIGLMREGWVYWASALGTNLATLAVIAAISSQIGLGTFLLIQLPITLMACSFGVWLFYVQHQFEETHWDYADQWSFHDAALHGSSHLHLPAVLRWFTANIGVHHVHHLSSRIPYYRLPEVLADHPHLHDHRRMTLRDSVKTIRLVLWDEQARRLVTFKEACV
jgi:omega-6 fatty acid desaturase (delta-12 desaturase)